MELRQISPDKAKKAVFMTNRERWVYFILVTIGLILTVIFGLWWFQPSHIAHNFSSVWHILDLVLFALLSYVVWYQIVTELFSWETVFHMAIPVPMEPAQGLRVAFLTAFVPDKEPYDVLERTLAAMKEAEYPHDTWLLDEGDAPKAREICLQLGVNYFTRKGVAKYNQAEGRFAAKTKAGNYNAWYDQHGVKYDVVGQLDVDFVPRKNFLTRTLGYFRDPDVAFVGTPQIYGNQKESWIARGAAEQAFNFYGYLQKGLFGQNMTLLIGANHVVRVAAHGHIGGYSGHIVEDHLTGMRLYAKRWKSIYVPEVLAVGEGPATWAAYFSQQMRWAFGLIDILFRHSPRIFPRLLRTHAVNYFLLQQYYFYGLSQGIAVFLLAIYFFFGIQATISSVGMLLLLYPPVLVMQLVIFFWLQRYYISPKEESGWHLRGRVLSLAAWPVYLLAFASALIGKRLTYVVTPKGQAAKLAGARLRLFIPHLLLGSMTFVGIAISFVTGNQAPQLIFVAALNTLILFAIVLLAFIDQYLVAQAQSLRDSWSKPGVLAFPKNLARAIQMFLV